VIFQITIEGADFGSANLPDDFRGRFTYDRNGQVYFCTACARIWATVLAPGREAFPLCMPCALHGSVNRPGGSIWLIWDHPFNAALPEQVIRREASVMFRHWEKFDGRTSNA
jgi:hypothetical protein